MKRFERHIDPKKAMGIGIDLVTWDVSGKKIIVFSSFNHSFQNKVLEFDHSFFADYIKNKGHKETDYDCKISPLSPYFLINRQDISFRYENVSQSFSVVLSTPRIKYLKINEIY